MEPSERIASDWAFGLLIPGDLPKSFSLLRTIICPPLVSLGVSMTGSSSNDEQANGERREWTMAKKQRRQPQRPTAQPAAAEVKTGLNLKEMLSQEALDKLKMLEREVKAAREREEQEAAERRRREQEERERNKSFAELLEEYEKKGGGKYN
jgi:hypothetical protein